MNSTSSFKVRPGRNISNNIIIIPKDVSARLPSRGLVMVEGTINGLPFQTALEPDGVGSHWFKVDRHFPKLDLNKEASVSIRPSDNWPEPTIPKDVNKVLSSSKSKVLWNDITPMARWDFLRWIDSTKNKETRKKRIVTTFDMLAKGKRRPCCFNRTQCTDPELSVKGVLSLNLVP